ncbi:MAG TPA: hypothetical protein VIJ51_16050 [Solirubrobacteraceae bacterium]
MSAATDSRRKWSRRRSNSKPTASRVAHQPWQRVTAGAVTTAGVIGFAAWKVPLGLPGHRALGWLTMLVAARLIAGRGWGAGVGIVSAVLVLALGISPDGIYGVADYAIAGVLIDATLTARPSIAGNAVKLAVLGAIVLLAVGWIAPLGRSLTGGIPMAELWPSLVSVAGAGLSRLVVLDLAFGAVAGAMGWGLASALRRASDPALGRAQVEVAGAA